MTGQANCRGLNHRAVPGFEHPTQGAPFASPSAWAGCGGLSSCVLGASLAPSSVIADSGPSCLHSVLVEIVSGHRSTACQPYAGVCAAPSQPPQVGVCAAWGLGMVMVHWPLLGAGPRLDPG